MNELMSNTSTSTSTSTVANTQHPTCSALWSERVIDALCEAMEREGLRLDGGGWDLGDDDKGTYVNFDFTFRPIE